MDSVLGVQDCNDPCTSFQCREFKGNHLKKCSVIGDHTETIACGQCEGGKGGSVSRQESSKTPKWRRVQQIGWVNVGGKHAATQMEGGKRREVALGWDRWQLAVAQCKAKMCEVREAP